MGTPDFAVPALRALADVAEIVLVVTQPDRPGGRGHKLVPPPVKKTALGLGLEVAQPERLKDNEEFLHRLEILSPDLIVVAAYGKLLPKVVLQIPACGCVNIHASLLPKYRGAAPIHRAVAAGESESGITLMYMAEGLDCGDMIASESTGIEALNTGEAYAVLAELGAVLLMKNLKSILDGSALRIPQDESAASYAPPVEKSELKLDFTRSAAELVNHIRAMEPPGAFALLDGIQMKLRRARAECRATCPGEGESAKPGSVLAATAQGVYIAAGEGVVVAEILQLPGKKPLHAAEFLRGNRIEPGMHFG
jgi:methionyl-tRNA formyltransferase